MLGREEFFRRLDERVPGGGATDPASPGELYCERLAMTSLDELHRYSTDGRLYEFFEFSRFVDLQQTRAYVEKLQDRIGDGVDGRTAMYWVVRRKADGFLVGTMNLIFLDYARQSVEWGYGVDPELWGHGYVLEIQEMLKIYVFEVLELNRLQGMTMVENERTIASVLAAGMKHEGTLRQYYRKAGVYHDAWLYGMLRADYLESKQQVGGRRGVVGIDEVRNIVAAALADDSVTVDSGMHDLFSWDSLTHMSIMVAVSQQTGVSLSPADMTRGTSVKAIAALLAERS